MVFSAPKAKIVTINNCEGLIELSININDGEKKERPQHVLRFLCLKTFISKFGITKSSF